MSKAATVGVLLRYDETECPLNDLRAALDDLDGVETFDVEAEGRLGAMIESETLDTAHKTLRREIEPLPGVMVAWPVSVHYEPDTTTETIPAPATADERTALA